MSSSFKHPAQISPTHHQTLVHENVVSILSTYFIRSLCNTNNIILTGNIHFLYGYHIISHYIQHKCFAKLTILIPINEDDYCAVIIPEDAILYSHPTFPPHKVPYAIKEQY